MQRLGGHNTEKCTEKWARWGLSPPPPWATHVHDWLRCRKREAMKAKEVVSLVTDLATSSPCLADFICRWFVFPESSRGDAKEHLIADCLRGWEGKFKNVWKRCCDWICACINKAHGKLLLQSQKLLWGRPSSRVGAKLHMARSPLFLPTPFVSPTIATSSSDVGVCDRLSPSWPGVGWKLKLCYLQGCRNLLLATTRFASTQWMDLICWWKGTFFLFCNVLPSILSNFSHFLNFINCKQLILGEKARSTACMVFQDIDCILHSLAPAFNAGFLSPGSHSKHQFHFHPIIFLIKHLSCKRRSEVSSIMQSIQLW